MHLERNVRRELVALAQVTLCVITYGINLVLVVKKQHVLLADCSLFYLVVKSVQQGEFKYLIVVLSLYT